MTTPVTYGRGTPKPTATLTRVCAAIGAAPSASAIPTAKSTRFIGHLRPGLSGKVVPDATAPSQRQLPRGLRTPAREAAGAAQCHLAGSLLSAGSRRRRQRDGGGATLCISRTTSPGSAGRPNAFLEKMRRPSTSTSNTPPDDRSEEHTSELQSQSNLVCRLLLEKKKKKKTWSSYP